MASIHAQGAMTQKYKTRRTYNVDWMKWWTRAEKFIIVMLLIFASNGNFDPFIPRIPVTLWRAGAIAFLLIILARYIPLVIQVLLTNLPLTALLGFVAVSVTWSFAPSVSVEPILWTGLIAGLGVLIAVRFSLEEMFSLFVYTLLFSAIASIALVFIAPETVVHGPRNVHAGAWHGIYAHKNQFGIFMALGFSQVLLLGKRWGRWRFVMMALFFIAALGSTSATAVLLCVGSLLVLPLLRVLRVHHTLLLGSLLILVPIGLGILGTMAINYAVIAEALGRDATLTGRTELWAESLTLIAERPLGGWGMRGAFAPGSPIFDNIIWDGAPYAHNHWLDTTLDLGFVGITLYTLVLIPTLLRALAYTNQQKTLESAFPLIFLVFLHIANFGTESVLTMWDFRLVLFVAFGYGLALQGRTRGDMPYRREYEAV